MGDRAASVQELDTRSRSQPEGLLALLERFTI